MVIYCTFAVSGPQQATNIYSAVILTSWAKQLCTFDGAALGVDHQILRLTALKHKRAKACCNCCRGWSISVRWPYSVVMLTPAQETCAFADVYTPTQHTRQERETNLGQICSYYRMLETTHGTLIGSCYTTDTTIRKHCIVARRYKVPVLPLFCLLLPFIVVLFIVQKNRL